MARLPRAFPAAPAPAGYFERLGEAMRVWTELCAGPDELPPGTETAQLA